MKPTTARPPAAAGSTPASTPTASTRPRGASPVASRPGSRRSGAGRGRRTGASSTTARRPIPTASRGASARPTSGGTRTSRSGPATTSPTSWPTKAPSYRPPPGAAGIDALRRRRPVHHAGRRQGAGCSRRPGCSTARCPRTTSRSESPVRNPFYRQQANPTREVFPRKDNLQNPSPPEPGSDVFPYVFTTYRLTEHHTAGGMSRWVPYLSELQPEFFCEVSPELARERDLEHLGWATIVTARTAIEARVLVTDRMVPLRVGGRVVHQVGLPYHWGVGKDALVDAATRPTTCSASRSTRTCTSRSRRSPRATSVPGGGPTGPALLRFVEEYRSRAGITVETGNTTAHPGGGRMTSAVRPRSARGRARGVGRPAAAQGLLHRHLDLHRLQGLRGRLQGVERRPRRRASTCSARPTTTPARSGASTWRHVAFIEQPRAAGHAAARASRGAPVGTAGQRRAQRGRRRRAGRRPQRCSAPTRRRSALGMPSTQLPGAERSGRPAHRLPLADVARTCASTARTRPAWTSARPARCSAPSSAPSSSRTTSATAAGTACRPARSASSTGASATRTRHRTSASRRSARSATTGSAPGTSRRARRPARPSPSSSATSTSCASAPRPGSTPLHAAGVPRGAAVRREPRRRHRRRRRDVPAARRARGLRPAAGPGGLHHATCRRCGSTPGWPRSRCSARRGHLVPRTPMSDASAAGSHRAGTGRRRRRRRYGRRAGGAGRDVHVLLRPAGRQGLAVGGGHPGLPVPRRPGRRLVAARGRRRPHRPARAAPDRPARRAGRDHGRASPRWCTTSAGRRASSTCCGSPSRPRRCRSAPGSCRCTGRRPALAGAAELPLPPVAAPRCCVPFVRPAGLGAALTGPAVATYTAVLLADTATPAWNEARRELPFVFVGSAASAAGGLGMIGARFDEAGPARRLAFAGAVSEVTAEQLMERSMGMAAETLHQGKAGRIHRAGRVATGVGGSERSWPRSSAAASAPRAGVLGRGRRRPARGLGLHPVRDLRGRSGIGPRPEVHGGAAARAGRPPAGRRRLTFLIEASPLPSCG